MYSLQTFRWFKIIYIARVGHHFFPSFWIGDWFQVYLKISLHFFFKTERLFHFIMLEFLYWGDLGLPFLSPSHRSVCSPWQVFFRCDWHLLQCTMHCMFFFSLLPIRIGACIWDTPRYIEICLQFSPLLFSFKTYLPQRCCLLPLFWNKPTVFFFREMQFYRFLPVSHVHICTHNFNRFLYVNLI